MKLTIENVSQKYGDFYALSDFNAEFTEGIYGLLGPNGAGKTTLMNLLTDNLKRTAGSIRLNDKDILDYGEQYRYLLGYMPQQQGFYEQFSAMEFLAYIGRLKGLKGKELYNQIETLLKKVNLYEFRHKAVGAFSGGMRQRVLLAQALLGEPRIIILDEPTAGLDPKERINIRNLIADIAEDRIVFIATHIVSDIECIANEILLLKKGKLICKESPENLIESIHGKVGEILCVRRELEKLQLKYSSGNIIQRYDGLYLRIVGDNLPKEAEIVDEGATLEDVYMYYIESDNNSEK